MSDADMFDYTPPQGDLFPEAPQQPQRGRILDFPGEARRRLMKVLAEASAAERLPWSEREAAKWEVLFPQMAGWLPDDEASQLCFEFARELARLRKAA